MSASKQKNDEPTPPTTLEPDDEKNILGRKFIAFNGILIILLLLYVLFFAMHK